MLVAGVSVRPMREADLPEVTDIFRVAFGTFLRVPDLRGFWADRDYTGTRWRANPGAALVAEMNGGANWGSFAFFGPLTIRPELYYTPHSSSQHAEICSHGGTCFSGSLCRAAD